MIDRSSRSSTRTAADGAMSSVDHLVVAVGELLRHPGTRRPVTVRGRLPDLALSSARVPDEGEVEAELVLESQHDSLTATGTVRIPWVGECRRCLRPIEGMAETDVREVFERAPVEGETYRLDADRVDLRALLRDAALLALPLAPLCAPTCPGPVPDAYPVALPAEAASKGGSTTTAGVDPPFDRRWAALEELRFDQ
jgi:uncharacterized protein